MDRTQRIALFLITLVLLSIIFYFWQDTPLPQSVTATVIFTSLVMVSFVTLFLEHWFTKPTDVLAASISILLLLAPLSQQLDALGVWYAIFFWYNLVMAAAALLALLLLDNTKASASLQNRMSYYMKEFATTFGHGRLLYFALFILTMLFYIDSQSSFFMVLFVYSAAILLADPKRFLLRLATGNPSHSDDIGEIFGVQSKNIFLVKLYHERKPVRRFDFVEFRYSMDMSDRVRKGLIIDNYLLNQEQWVKVLTSSDISKSVGDAAVHVDIRDNVVYKLVPDDSEQVLPRFVGVVVENSNILTLRFEYGSNVPVAEGTLLEVTVGTVPVLYQIVQGVTGTELLESKNEAGFIIGHAVQLGTWNAETLAFDRFGWLPEVNSPVYLAKTVKAAQSPPGEFLIGHIPDTNFPVFLNKEHAISHHLAILGVTGSGKSVLARDLIRRFAADATKIICVDFTNEYTRRFADLDAGSIVSADRAEAMFQAIDALSEEMAEFKNKRNQGRITHFEKILTQHFNEVITGFLQSNRRISIFELPDVSNTTSILDYTRWFFKILFQIAKSNANCGKQICMVLEEAHTVVPEWNFIGTDDKVSQSLVNSIGQIALQGRKYQIGFMVIAQRTANVSKTVLTQCNSVIAFQQFDKTGADFLTNYMGSEMVAALPMLRPRQAIAVGKAFRSGMPTIFQVPHIDEP